MTNSKCPRCQSEFYSAISRHDIACPFCGFSFKIVEQDYRGEVRSTIQRDCTITSGGKSISAKTVDISMNGMGIRLKGTIPFEKDDIIRAMVRDFDINNDAQIVWLKRYNSSGTKAGLRFS